MSAFSVKRLWPVAGVLLVGLALRLAFLGSMEFWWDEYVTIGRAMADIPTLLYGLMFQSPAAVGTDCSPPLHHLLVHVALQFSHSEAVIKLPSVACGMLSIVFVMLFGRRAFGDRVGFLAGLFCALSLFHIYYSRDVRWYSTYFACSLAGMWLLQRALDDGAWKHWLGFAACTALSLYAAYTSATAVAGQVLFLTGLVVLRVLRGHRAGAKGLAVRAFAAMSLALILYAPWMPAQYIAFLSFQGKGATAPFELGPFLSFFRFFLEYFYQDGFNAMWLAVPLCLVGVLSALADPARRGWLILVSCWALVPVAAAYNVKTEFGVSPKYVMSLFYFFAFTLALGVDAVAARLARWVGFARGAWGHGLAVGLLVLVMAANFNYPAFYQGKTVSHKALVREMALAADAGDYMLYERERGFIVVGDWFLGDCFPTAREDMGRDYKRYLMAVESVKSLPGAMVLSQRQGATLLKGGLVNRAPLLAVPGPDMAYLYAEPFTGLGLYNDAWSTSNAAVDLASGGLVPADVDRPGSVTYALDAPAGMALAGVRVSVATLFQKRNLLAPDGYVEVSAGSSPEALRPVGRLDASCGPPGSGEPDYVGFYTVNGAWDLDQEALAGGRVFVSLRFSVGTRDGYVKTSALRMEAALTGTPPTQRQAASAQAQAILANVALADPAKGQVGAASGQVLAFTADESLLPADAAGRIGSPGEREAFCAANPQAVKVYAARTPDGRPFLEIYDPWIDSYLRLAGDARQPLPFVGQVRGIKAPGSKTPALVSWNQTVLPLSLGLPASSVSFINPGGQGFILARPQFDDQHFDPRDFHALRDVRTLAPRPCLTCIRDEPCQATYRFASIFPFTRLVLTTYPFLFNDAARRNWLRLSVSADGGEFREVFSQASNGDMRQTGMAYPRVDEVVLDKPAKEVVIRLEMANESSQWWSGPDTPMTFELFCDQSMWTVPQAQGVEVANITPDGGRAALRAAPTPYRAWERLRHGLVLRKPWSWLF